MIKIDSWDALARAIDQPADPTLKALLISRREQLAGCAAELSELAIIIVVEGGDSLDMVEERIGLPIVANLVDGSRLGESDFMPSWEYAQRHASGWTEIVFVLSDDGIGHVILVPDADGIDPFLTQLCQLADPPLDHTEDTTTL